MMMRLTFATIVLGMLCSGAQAELKEWELGGGGLSWRGEEQSSTAISFAGNAIELVGFNPDENIVGILNWIEGYPLDFVAERADASVWDNVPFKQSNIPLVDGDPSTSSDNRFKEFGRLQSSRTFFFDLGTRFPVNQIIFYPRQEGEDSRGRPYFDDFIRGYKIQINDGDHISAENLPIYELLAQVDFTTESVAETLFPLQFVRYVQLNVTSTNPFEIAEMEMYGAGFAPVGRYSSRIIDLGEPANFRRLRWSSEGLRSVEGSVREEPDADAAVTFRMRTGQDDTPQVFYEITNVFTGDTREVSPSAYGRLQPQFKGPVEDDQRNWSEWSAPFTEPGQQINLPSPRQYFQIEVELSGQTILDGIRVNSLAVEHSIPPLAQQLIGEISVLAEPRPPGNRPQVTAGVPSLFAYDVRADIGDADVGFDAIEIFSAARPLFREFLVGDPLVSVVPDSFVQSANSLKLFFPTHRLTTESADNLRIVFESQIFVQATVFDAQVSDTKSDEPSQNVLPGDAIPWVSTNDLRVLTTAESARDLLPSFDVQPRVVTPNGDGINDVVGLSYILVQLRQPVPVEVQVVDLSGRRVRTVFSGSQSSGSFSWDWDGRDDAGKRVPVGIYIGRVVVGAEREEFVRLATIGVAY